MARAQARRWGRRPGAGQDALFDLGELDLRPERRYYRDILAMLGPTFGAEPLRAEVTVSRILGVVWANDAQGDGGAEEAFGSGLVDYAREAHTPTAVALLRTLGVVATAPLVRAAATTAAAALVATGLPDVAIGPVRPTGCWVVDDDFGDASTLTCAYESPDHAIVVRIDHSYFGAATACALTDSVEPGRPIDPGWAGAVLARGFGQTDLMPTIGVAEGFASLRALALARVETLPFAPQSLVLPAPLPTAAVSRLAAEFLREHPISPEVVELLASFCADRDPGNPLRVGPAKWEAFLFDFLPAGPLPPGLAEGVRAWSGWAAQRQALSAEAAHLLRSSLEELLAIRS